MKNLFARCNEITSLDLSQFNTTSVTDMSRMFSMCHKLGTIYVGNNWNTNSVSESTLMFEECSRLVGGNGTTFNGNFIDKTYARVDRAEQVGYLTLKNN